MLTHSALPNLVAPQASYAAVGHTAPAAQIQLATTTAGHGGLAAYGGHYAAPALAYTTGGHYGGITAAAAPAAIAYGGHYAATAPALQLASSGVSHLGGYASYGGYGGYGYSAAPALSHGYLAAAAPAPVVKYAAAPAYGRCHAPPPRL